MRRRHWLQRWTSSRRILHKRGSKIVMRLPRTLQLLALASLLHSAASADVPDRQTADAKIRTKCASDFPDNFSTQAYCIKTNKEGYAKFVTNRMSAKSTLSIAYDRCQRDFGDDGNWSTAAYCARTNTDGYEEFLGLKASAPPALLRSYAKCERDFGSDGNWSTAAYCAKREREAFRELQN